MRDRGLFSDAKIGRLYRVVAIVCCAFFCFTPKPVLAHPLGNFTINHYSRLEPFGGGVRIRYVLDMAEIPTLQETPRIDQNGDGQIDAAERDAYAVVRAEEVRRNLRLALNGTSTPIRRVSQTVSFPEGQGGLPTLRLEVLYVADLLSSSAGEAVRAEYHDDDESSRIGWREIVVRAGAAGAKVQESSASDRDVSNELRVYPDDLLSSPLNMREARFVFTPGPPIAQTDSDAPLNEGIRAVERVRGVMTGLVTLDDVTPWTVMVSLMLATVLGAQHALTPGHGKTVVAAYLVGARGTARHAFFLGATVTATHTLGVFALGFVTLFLSHYILPERLYPMLEVISGLLVMGIGGWLFAGRLRGALANWHSSPTLNANRTYDHDLAHDHNQQHSHDHPHSDDHEHHHHSHDHTHSDDHEHQHSHDHSHNDDHEHQHSHDHHGLVHSHSGSAHTHLPPGADGSRVTWRSLLVLGVSGGLLPCPTALVLLLGAIALNQVVFGLVLTLFFSLGLAGVLVGIGLLLVYARPLLQKVSLPGGPITRLIPVGSAMVITLAGLAITVAALPAVLAL